MRPLLTSLRKRRPPVALAGTLGLLGGAVALPCAAAERCVVEVTGARNPDWDRAVASLELDRGDADDCRAIRLELGSDTSRLTFLTKDGRSAERELVEPSELAPTVDALLVTGAPSSAEGDPPPREETPPRLTPDADPRRPPGLDAGVQPSHRAGEETTGPLFVFGLELGARGGGGGLIGPLFAGTGGVAFSRWELGVWGSFEPAYGWAGSSESVPTDVQAPDPTVDPAARPEPQPEPEGSAIAAGISAGRRWAFSHLDLIGGARLGVAALQNDIGGRQGAEVRTGVAMRLVFPRRSTVRFRTGLALDVVPNDLGRSNEANVPWWALAGTLGVEIGGT